MRTHGLASTYKHGCRCTQCREANTIAQRKWKQKVAGRPPEGVKHGRLCYVNYGCRCEICRRGNAEASAEGRGRRGSEYSRVLTAKSVQRARERAKADPSLIPHGEYRGYTYWGCRCPECKAACVAYWREYRARNAAAGQ